MNMTQQEIDEIVACMGDEIIEAIQAAIEFLDDLPEIAIPEAEAERKAVIKKLSRALDAIDGGEE